MAKSPEEARRNMIEGLKDKTGKTLEEWLALIPADRRARHSDVVKYLKEDHGLTHGYANQVALQAMKPAGAPEAGSDDLVTAQYQGNKAALRPIYDALVSLISGFGEDIEFAPKKAYVSVRRSKQFAIIQPSTATRVDLGINLKGHAAKGRLEESGSFNAMVSHRVRLSSPGEVDAELKGWLKQAYDKA